MLNPFKPVHLCSILGVPVSAHWSVLLWPSLYILLSDWHLAHRWQNCLFGACLLVGLYTCLLVHEFAHVLMGRCSGYSTKGVYLLPIGCVAEFEQPPHEPEEIPICIAGPMASVLLAGVFASAAVLFRDPQSFVPYFLHELLQLMAFANIIIAALNLLPIFPLDGGRIARSLTALAIARVKPTHASRAQRIATGAVLRLVSWPVALGLTTYTIRVTHIWPHLAILVLAILLGELEYWVLRLEARLEIETSPSLTPEQLMRLPLAK
jgi:Zn-dependent protease